MTLSKPALYSAGVFIAVAAIGAFTAPKLSAAIRAAFVEVAIPSKPFYDSLSGLTTGSRKVVGPDSGTLGVSNITLTNFDSYPQQVFIFPPLFASGGCGAESGVVSGGGSPDLQVYVQPYSTLVIPYPSPLVFSSISGHTCVAVEVTTPLHGGSVDMDVTGFVN